MIDNLEKCLKCLSSKNISTQGITAKQLREGNLKAVLGLFFALSRHKQQLQQEEQQRKQAAKQQAPPTAQSSPKPTSNTSTKQSTPSGSNLPRRNASAQSSTTSKSATTSSRISIPKVQSSSSSRTSQSSRPPSQNLSSSRPSSTTSSQLKPLGGLSQSRSSSPSSSHLRQSGQSSRTGQSLSQSRSSSQSQSRLVSQSQSRTTSQSQSRPSSQSHSRPTSQSHSRPTSQTSLSGQSLSVSRTASSRSPSQSRPNSQCSGSGQDLATPRSRTSLGQRAAVSQGNSATSGLQKRLSSTSVGQNSGSTHSRTSTSSSVDMSSRIPTRGLHGPNNNQNRLSSGSEKSRTSTPSPSGSVQGTKSNSKMSSSSGSSQRLSRPASKLKAPTTGGKQAAKPEPPQRTTSIKQSQMAAGPEKTIPVPAASAGKEKGSMLTKLKLFSGEKSKEGEGAKTPTKLAIADAKLSAHSTSRLAAPKSGSSKPLSAKSSKLQGPRKSGDFSKQSVVSKIAGSATSSPKRRSSSADIKKSEPEGIPSEKSQTTNSPKSSLKAVAQKTIGKAFGANPKSKESPKAPRKAEEMAHQSGQLSDIAIYSDTGYESMDKSKDTAVTVNGRPHKTRGHESSDDGYLSANSTHKKSSKIAVPPSKIIAPPPSTGKSQMSKVKPVQKGVGKSAKSSGLAAPKAGSTPKASKEAAPPLESPFQRGGVYSTFPSPNGKPSRNGAMSPAGKQLESPVAMRVEDDMKETIMKGSLPSSPGHKTSLPPSPSRGLRTPANTATVAPFNYSTSKFGEEANGCMAMHSQVSVSSNTSQSSENSVIFKQKSIEEEVCTTEYENDKVVTTFGTPKSQRAYKTSNSAIRNRSNILVMNMQADTASRSMKETTFGDSVTTQVTTQSNIIPPLKIPAQKTGTKKSKKESYSKIAIAGPGKASSTVPIPSSVQSQAGAMSMPSAQRFLPAPSLTKLHSSHSIRRTFSNRSHLSDLQYSDTLPSNDGSECASEDVVNGYVSDGDVLHRNGPLSDISGYMSEGGSTLYARRMGTLFRGRDGMAALREYLQKPVELSDDDSGDSSSISSGALSDTINEISTDENVTGSSSRNSFESGKNLEIFGDEIILDDYDGIGSRAIDPGDGYLSDSRLKVSEYLRAGGSFVQSRRSSAATDGGIGLSDSNTMSRIEIRKSAASSGSNPPPSWQRSLDRLQARNRSRFDSSLTAAQQKSLVSSRGTLELSRNQSKGSTQGSSQVSGTRGQTQGGFGYHKNGSSSSTISSTTQVVGGKSGLSPAGLAAQKSIKDTINKLSLKSAKLEQVPPKTSPTDGRGVPKKTSPGTAPMSRLKPSLGGAKTPTSQSSVWMKQNGSDAKSRAASNNIKTGSLKRTSPSGTRTILSQTSPTSKTDKNDRNAKDASLKNLFNRTKGEGGKDTIISNPHATLGKKGHSSTSSRGSSHQHLVNMSDTEGYSPRTQRALTQRALSTVDSLSSKIPYDDGLSAFSGYMSDSFTSGKSYGYSSVPFSSQNQHKYALGNHSFLSKRPETSSMESLESNNSSAFSVASHAMSEQVGPTYRQGLSSNISRSPSLRSTLSDRPVRPHLSLLEKNTGQVDWMSGNYAPVAGDRTSVQLSPTESTLSHPPMSFFPVSMGNMQNHPMLSRQLRNGSLSMDERQRAALSICALFQEGGSDDFKGSSQSLMSTTSLYSTPEERAASEIHRLKRDLEREQDRVSSLSINLNANAHVVAAFEQSLSGMTNRLQQLTSSTEQKDSELQDLREKIEQLKVAHSDGRNGTLHRNGSVDGLIRKHSLGNIVKDTGEARISRQTSCESMSSLASMTSMSSAGSAMTDTEGLDSNKKKKKNWIRSSFRSAFGRNKKKASGTTTDTEDLESSMTFSNGTIHSQGQSQLKQSASTSALYDAEESLETITDLKRQLRDKEGKLTDIKLEALSSQHQLDQMQECMNKMKTEMMQLKQENERLQRQVQTNRKSLENSSLNSLNSNGSSKRLSRDSLDRHRLSANSDHGSGSLDILIDDNSGMTNNSQRIVVTVTTNNQLDTDKEVLQGKLTEVMIGTIGISSKTNWDALDSVIRRIFKEYVLRIDPMTNLGLSAESVHHYVVGEITRSKDSDNPELLPCGYLVGENTSIHISLKGFQHNSCDSLVFETLVPKPILQRYISLLLEHKRIILCGPSGTGKTYLAQKLAGHIVQRNGKEPSEGCIATFNVDHKSGKELRQYLTHIADQCEANALDLPTVIILDNLHNAGSLGEIFTGFLSYKYNKCPYIIGTMNQATCQSTNLQLHHNFRWVLCANHMEPVKGFLGRYLRRKLIESEIKLNTRNNDLNKIIEWIPKVWQHLNKFLETHNSSDVTIGPRLFLSCPIDFPGSQVWFTDLWNYSIVPYLLEAVREGLQLYGRKAPWEDPSDWVVESYPWASSSSQEWPSLLRLRPQDIGFDGYKIQGGSAGQQGQNKTDVEGDPLFNMLMRLQEAANYSNTQSCDSDTNSLDSCGNSREDLRELESII